MAVPGGATCPGYVAEVVSQLDPTETRQVSGKIDGHIAGFIALAPFLHDHVRIAIEFLIIKMRTFSLFILLFRRSD